MKCLFNFVVTISVLLTLHHSVLAQGGRGVVPLHSTRADVQRLLGRPKDAHDRYEFEGEWASIMYTRGPCSGGMQGAYNVPPDTVVSIDVTPKKRLSLSDLNLDTGEYKRSLGGWPGNELASYHSEKAGVTYVAYVGGADAGKIRVIIYGLRAEDARLRCPAAPGEADADEDTGTQSASDYSGPLGECPTVDIEGSSD